MFLRRLLLAAPLLFASTAFAQNTPMSRRWFYLQTNFQTDANVSKAQELLKRAKAAGYNGMVVTDSKFDILDRVPPRYFQNVEAVRKTAKELNIGVYPAVCGAGYEGGVLSRDPQLAEAFPVRFAPFVARNGALEPVSEVALQNGDFETSTNNKFRGWTFQDTPGEITVSDQNEKHSGTSSVRMEGFGGKNGRVVQALEVKPHSWHHVSVWIKTRDFDTPGDARALAMGEGGKQLAWVHWDIKRTQDWTRYDTAFNTGDSSKVSVYFGVWGGRGGKIWWDDARVESAGLFNVVRRPGAPFSAKTEDGTLLEEGRDFQEVRDEKVGAVPWPGSFDDWHPSPLPRLTPNSRIKDGQTVLLDFYAVQKADEGSVAPCLSEPKTFEIMRDQIRRVTQLWQPAGLFLAPDEIRQLGSCKACEDTGKTSGQILSSALQKCIAIAREGNSKRELWLWSDMVDPHHNARDSYYLAKGSLLSSWEGVDPGVGIMNWNFGSRDKSLDFFSKRGHKQTISGFYDGDESQIKDWMNSAKDVPNVEGAMYTTWTNDYSKLESFAQNVWGK